MQKNKVNKFHVQSFGWFESWGIQNAQNSVLIKKENKGFGVQKSLKMRMGHVLRYIRSSDLNHAIFQK